jgi:hypothetical protein
MSSTSKSLTIGIVLAVVVVGGLTLVSIAATRILTNEKYPQNTPEEVLASARAMVTNGDARLLPNLIHADDPRMRAMLSEFGKVLGSLHTLALDVQQAFPEEIAALQAEAAAAAKSGQASSFIQRMAGQAGMSRRDRRGQDPAEMRKVFDNAAKELFADPYGWLERSGDRLTVQTYTDDTAGLLWDKKPAFGIGLLIRRVEGRWYLSLPIDNPFVARILPKSDETWDVMASLMDVFNNTVKDLSKDVRSGRAAKLDDLARTAGEKAFIPAAITVFALSKAMEAERESQKKAQAAPAPPR